GDRRDHPRAGRRPLHGRGGSRGRGRSGVRALRHGAPMSDGLLVKVVSLVVFIACSALFTGAEAAYFSLGRARLKRVAAQGAEAGAAKPLIERPHELLVTLLVGITVINIAASAVAALIADELFGQRYALVIQVLVTIMVPRPDMFCLDVATPVDRILPALREHLHSRVPVFEGSIDVIVGILYTKDLLPYVREGLPPDFDLRARLHPPYFVPESKRADTLLQE